MPEVVCNTSPLQYLHQLDLLHILPALKEKITIPPAVIHELSTGQQLGINLPTPQNLDWVTIRRPATLSEIPEIIDLGPGETEVLALDLEISDSIVILADALGRLTAETLNIRFTGTLGLLLDAKKNALIDNISSYLDRLQTLGFRLTSKTRDLILNRANE